MSIESNASPDELSSPYYIANKNFCIEFEKFIVKRKGEVKGKYNAYSFFVIGNIKAKKYWKLTYKRATYSSSGILYLDAEKECLLLLAKWETELTNNNAEKFLIRKRTNIDNIRMLFDKGLNKIKTSKKYIIKTNNPECELITKLTRILNVIIKSEELYEIELKNSRLRIEMRTGKQYFDLFNRLMNKI